MKQRIFRTHVNLRDASEIADWKEITEKQKEQMLADAAIIDVDDMDVASIKRVDAIIGKVANRINDVPMTVEESLELVAYFPKWEEGKEMPIGYKVSYDGSLFEVIQEHTSQVDWKPREAKSLFKVVQVESEGSEDDIIQWEQGMVLEEGKFYIDNGVKYKCVRDSGNALWYSLDVLVGNYVEIVEE
ncbi:MAG: hypothetical protein J6R54_06895 [Bacteroidaceae bacterium]|nr:hypothetical protein [Bacteroidaceae bacterium]